MSLEAALRRRSINAVLADGAVQEELSYFLKVSPCNWPSRVVGLNAEVLRHLARVPKNLEASALYSVLRVAVSAGP